jgi:hypothetical protein
MIAMKHYVDAIALLNDAENNIIKAQSALMIGDKKILAMAELLQMAIHALIDVIDKEAVNELASTIVVHTAKDNLNLVNRLIGY